MLIFFQISFGLILLIIGGEILIRGAVAIARNLNIAKVVIGLTVIAYGTSSPELVVSVNASIHNYPDIAIGNVIGSNIANILMVLGITALVFPIKIDKKLAYSDGAFLLAITFLFIIFCYPQKLGLAAGAVFLTTLILYTILTIYSAKMQKQLASEEIIKEIEEQIKVELTPLQSLLACVSGIVLLIYGSDTLIDGSVNLARIIGVSEAVIGLTIIAFGSSTPELVTCIAAARHKHSDIALGNVIGSCIFNILGIVGATASISPLNVANRFLYFDLPIMLFVTILLIVITKAKTNITRIVGLCFVSFYIIYLACLVFLKNLV